LLTHGVSQLNDHVPDCSTNPANDPGESCANFWRNQEENREYFTANSEKWCQMVSTSTAQDTKLMRLNLVQKFLLIQTITRSVW
jgi:hypothetical protein